MGLMLDTSIFIAAERRRFDLLSFIATEPNPSLFMSAVTASELLQGVYQADAAHRPTRLLVVEDAIATFPALPFDLDVARVHSELRAILRRAGTPVGEHDLMIAATALRHNLEIITMDLRSFPRVPGLRSRLVHPIQPTP